MENTKDQASFTLWQNALSRVKKSQRLQELVNAKDSPLRIAGTPIQELFYAITETGLPDALSVLPYITPKQFQGFIDLAAWKKDRFSLEESVEWLQALLQSSLSKFEEVITRVDEEWLLLFLRRYIQVYDSQDEVAVVPENASLIAAPDQQLFLLVFDSAGNGALAMKIIESFYKWEVIQGIRLLEACRAELNTEIEENARQFRQGRLEEMGFFSYEEAVQVYFPISPKMLQTLTTRNTRPNRVLSPDQIHVTGLPALYLRSLEEEGILAKALGFSGGKDLAQNVFLELAPLINRVLAARQIDPSDEEMITSVVLHVRGMLDIGLKYLANHDLVETKKKLSALSLTELFRVGFTQIALLSKRARAVKSSQYFPLLEEKTRQMIQNLLPMIPDFSNVLSNPPGEGTKPFQNESELSLSKQEVEFAEASLAMAVLFEWEPKKFLSQTYKGAATIDIKTLFNTSVSNALLGRDFFPFPISPNEITSLQSKLFSAEDLEVVDTAKKTLASLDPVHQKAAQKQVQQWLSHLLSELKDLSKDAWKRPQFIGGILLA